MLFLILDMKVQEGLICLPRVELVSVLQFVLFSTLLSYLVSTLLLLLALFTNYSFCCKQMSATFFTFKNNIKTRQVRVGQTLCSATYYLLSPILNHLLYNNICIHLFYLQVVYKYSACKLSIHPLTYYCIYILQNIIHKCTNIGTYFFTLAKLLFTTLAVNYQVVFVFTSIIVIM